MFISAVTSGLFAQSAEVNRVSFFTEHANAAIFNPYETSSKIDRQRNIWLKAALFKLIDHVSENGIGIFWMNAHAPSHVPNFALIIMDQMPFLFVQTDEKSPLILNLTEFDRVNGPFSSFITLVRKELPAHAFVGKILNATEISFEMSLADIIQMTEESPGEKLELTLPAELLRQAHTWNQANTSLAESPIAYFDWPFLIKNGAIIGGCAWALSVQPIHIAGNRKRYKV